MAASFYVWDAVQHNPQTTISTLEQAEYFATHPQDLGLTENLKNWLLDVEQIVTNPELSENFDESYRLTFLRYLLESTPNSHHAAPPVLPHFLQWQITKSNHNVSALLHPTYLSSGHLTAKY